MGAAESSAGAPRRPSRTLVDPRDVSGDHPNHPSHIRVAFQAWKNIPKNRSQMSSRAIVRSSCDQIIDFPSKISSRKSDSVTFPSVSSPVPGRFPPGENPSHFWATCPKIGLRRAPELSEKKVSTRIPLGEACRGLEGPDVIFLFSNGPPKSSLRSPLSPY